MRGVEEDRERGPSDRADRERAHLLGGADVLCARERGDAQQGKNQERAMHDRDSFSGLRLPRSDVGKAESRGGMAPAPRRRRGPRCTRRALYCKKDISHRYDEMIRQI